MRKEVDFGQGRTLVFEDCGPNQFVISMLADYQVQKGEGARDKLTGRAIKYSTCLTGFHMVDVLKEAVTEWYKGNEENKLPPPKMPAFDGKPEEIPTKGPTTKERLDHLTKELIETVAVVRDMAAMCAQGFSDLEGRMVALEKRPIGKVTMSFPPVIGVLGDLPVTEDGQPTHVQAARAAAYNEELKTKDLRWYRVTFDTSQQVVEAVRMTGKQWPYQLKAECRDFDDGMHACIRQASSLREAIKVSEFERQFGGCKKSKVTG